MANINEIWGTDIRHKKDYVKDSTSDRALISGFDNLKDALFRRLVTEPGTLVHRPEYGVGIKQFLNAPNTLSNQKALAVRINEQFLRDDRVQQVLGVAVNQDPKFPDRLTVIVRVKPVGYDEVAMNFKLFSEE